MRQADDLAEIAKSHLICGPTVVEATRSIAGMSRPEELPPPIKGRSGGYLCQSAFRSDLLEDINQKAK